MSLPAQRHVFISYSRADSAFVTRLIRDLEAHDIGVWVDVEGLQPGTPNWEKSIREAIHQAFAIVFIASPDSAQSSPVHGELSIAGDSNKTILPVWATGNHWSSCAPFDMMRAQYIDLRADHYAANLDQLIAAIEQQRPTHMILDEDAPPLGYFKVALGDFGDLGAIAFKEGAFPALRQFADTLYSASLRDRLAPFTYGSQWILASDAGLDQPWLGVRRLCVPFSWLFLTNEQRRQPLARLDAHWADGPLASFGVKSGTTWQVMAIPDIIFGIATDEDFFASIFDALTDGRLEKVISAILLDGHLQERSEAHQAYRYQYVCASDGRQPRTHLNGKVMVPRMEDYYREFMPQSL
jgi:TIR domain-containing protein